MKTSKGSDRTLKLIGAFKLLKGLLLIGLAFGALKILGHNPQAELQNILQSLSVDPGSRLFEAVVRKVITVSPRFPLVATGTAVYGLLFCIEGFGLLKRRRWAEWLTVIATGSFIPLEAYEMAEHTTVTKGIVLVLNAAIVVFLILHLRRERKTQPDYRIQDEHSRAGVENADGAFQLGHAWSGDPADVTVKLCRNHLGKYLNDHLAGSVTVIDLLEHLQQTLAGKDMESLLVELREDVISDRQMLQALMRRVQVGQHPHRTAVA